MGLYGSNQAGDEELEVSPVCESVGPNIPQQLFLAQAHSCELIAFELLTIEANIPNASAGAEIFSLQRGFLSRLAQDFNDAWRTI